MTAMEWKQTAIPYGCSYAAKIIYCDSLFSGWVALEDASHITHGNGRRIKGRSGGAEPLGDGGDLSLKRYQLKPERKADIRGGN